MYMPIPLGLLLAHPFGPHQGSWWIIEPTITAGVIIAIALYFYAIGPLRRRLALAATIDRRQVLYFLLAMVLVFCSLQGPLHELSDYYSFAAHMVQHLVITMIVPPLLLKGLPRWLVDAALRLPGVLPVARLILHPYVAFAIFNVTFALWHVPAAYQMALGRPLIHGMEHLLFMGTAVIAWWPIYGPSELLPPLNDPLQMLYLFAQSIVPTVLGAILTFADASLYPFYASAPRIIHLSVSDDQQIAGLIMWLGGASIILLVLSLRFFRWMERDADDTVEPVRAQLATGRLDR